MRKRPLTRPATFISALIPCNRALRRCPVPPSDAEVRIIIFRAGAFGDILMGTPLLSALREAHPSAHITWIAEAREADAIIANPEIDEIVLWNTDGWKRLNRLQRKPVWLWYAIQLLVQMRRRKYDIYISLEPEKWPALLFAINAPVTVGVFDTFWRFYGAPYKGRLTRSFKHTYTQLELPEHRTDQYLLALDALGLAKTNVSHQMTIGYASDDRRVASDFLKEHQLDAGSFVVLAASTTWPTKCWPAERFSSLANDLSADGYRIVLTGAPGDAGLIEEVTRGLRGPAINAIGRFTFRQLTAVIDRAALLVSGDTGPMHVAAALGTPYVAMFGPTDSKWYGPQAGRGTHLWHSIPCGPCDKMVCSNKGDDNHRCMRLLTVDEVYAASRALLPTKQKVESLS